MAAAYRPDASQGPDPRTMGKVKLDSSADPNAAFSSSIPTDLLLALLLDKTLLASSALLVKVWLWDAHSESIHAPPASAPWPDREDGIYSAAGSHAQAEHTGAWAIASAVFIIAALGQAAWFRVWEWAPAIKRVDKRRLAILSLVMFSQLMLWLLAVGHLSATNVIIFSQYCDIWAGDLAKSLRGRSYGGYTILFALAVSFLSSFAAQHEVPSSPPTSFGSLDLDDDMPYSMQRNRPAGLASPSQLRAASAALEAEASVASYSVTGILLGHAYLLLFALATLEKERALLSASRDTGGRRKAGVVATVFVASVLLPLGLVGKLFGFATLPSISVLAPGSAGGSTGHLPAFVALALSFLVLEPLVSTALENHAAVRTRVAHGWPIAVLASATVGYVAFGVKATWSQTLIALVVGWALRTILKTSPDFQPRFSASAGPAGQPAAQAYAAQHSSADVSSLHELVVSTRSALSATRRHVKAILANPDSRKIFQFLCLNLAFMGVQLLWGVWTNSLGLISDAIHMFFDCAAIGMGLFASVMATWKTDSAFTYGYGRVETLSGFANGIFLILISIFIVFEAVQRIIEPPVMNNNIQLLIVSGMGLGVNLFGMFAMGGHHHHHHGHSHGHHHGHSHGHGHGHDHHGHGHDHGHGHGHDHGHGHSHNMMGVYLHVMADTLGSVGVIISTLLIQKFGWTGFDPVASLFIAALIVASVIPLVVDAGKILCLDMGEERAHAVTEALQELKTIEGVASHSSPRFWPKDAETLVGTIRIQVLPGPGEDGSVSAASKPAPSPSHRHGARVSPEAVARRVERLLKTRIAGLEAVSVQVEKLVAAGAGGSPSLGTDGATFANGHAHAAAAGSTAAFDSHRSPASFH
ncbi:uncharacterized protein PFL1_02122 [Pseudozyma flocculosa PF-1]|uniref:Related to zinc transporter n=1 Tax=Pseudozyma flocculosa TaxID=84751 RepID=A0A5C3EZI9_9BASI|nr:uncharacterized protein PFL1_02122 [Pseudozyma flocculosa PF-1]EPQ30598.1 hypothetical protein PFL1_02122 [Pseudozyma flocculosa PF-1]SPO37693.1 related to zinc transporter [Pseudozyma flocculosa]